MTTLLAWGNMTSMFGISIILRFQYNPFADVALPMLMVGTWAMGAMINYFCRKIADQTKLWSRRSLQGTVDDEIAAKLAVGEGRQKILKQNVLNFKP